MKSKLLAVCEMLMFVSGVVLMLGIPVFMKQFGMNMNIAFAIGIFEGMLFSSFARNIRYFPDIIRGWKAEFTKERKDRK